MLVSSVILILREVLEAAILITTLLALSRNSGFGSRWLWPGFGLGLIGIMIFSAQLDVITDALDGTGQEVANATLQTIVYILVVAVIATVTLITSPQLTVITQNYTSKFTHLNIVRSLMALTVSTALIREGSEIYIYLAGFSTATELRTSVFTGSIIGAGIGVSLGVLLYTVLRAFQNKLGQTICLVLLCLTAAGMLLQAAILLEQADWLPAQAALWDTTYLIDEQSVTGELLYAMFGYEATPTALQFTLYCASLAIALSAGLLAAHYRRSHAS